MMQQKIDYKENIRVFAKLPYKEGEYKSRAWGHPLHFLLSYPSKLKPALGHYLVKLFSRPGDNILDPFSGSGTIPFEACCQGRIGIGSDINPLAYHTTNAKVSGLFLDELEQQIDLLDEFIKKNLGKFKKTEKEIVDYYEKNTMNEILAAREFFKINLDKNYSFLISCIAHILHGNRPYALSRRSHNIMPWNPQGEFVYKNLIKHLREKVYRMKKVDLPATFVKGISIQDDVFKLSLKNDSVDSIMTSPPFFNNRDFLRMNRIRLWFCGWDYEIQNKFKANFIENAKDLGIYSKIFDEFYRVLKSSSLCILHLGVVKNVNMAEILSAEAKKTGFETLDIVYEDSSKLESHGIRDRGATHTHQFLFLRKYS